jgi:hypothetical protein
VLVEFGWAGFLATHSAGIPVFLGYAKVKPS